MAEYNGFTAPAPGLELRRSRRNFSRIGWGLMCFTLCPLAVQLTALTLLEVFAPGAGQDSVVYWLISILGQYAISYPIAALVILSLPTLDRSRKQRPNLTPVEFLRVLGLSLGVLTLGNLITLFLISGLDFLRGVESVNPLESVILDFPLPLSLLLSCVLAPICEELFFRSLLLRRLEPYGASFAATVSALCFGLMHANLYQLFYAFALGLVFAWVALYTGRIWPTILLHMCINFLGGDYLSQLLGVDCTSVVGTVELICMISLPALFAGFRRTLRRGAIPGQPAVDLNGRRPGVLFFFSPGVICFLLASLGLAVVVYLGI